MSDEKKQKVLYITHKGELLFWLIVLLIIIMILFFNHIKCFSNQNDEYNIFMPDVDGLIVGSPVRAMGIEIGHVTKIKPMKDDVYIKFIITDDNIKIPRGTFATVEFSGMAGSKSLELYLPDKSTYIDSSVPNIRVNPPKRLHDAAGLLNEMFKKIGNIIAVTSRFGHKISEIDFPEAGENINNTTDFLKFSNEIIDQSQERADNLGRKLNDYRDKKLKNN